MLRDWHAVLFHSNRNLLATMYTINNCYDILFSIHHCGRCICSTSGPQASTPPPKSDAFPIRSPDAVVGRPLRGYDDRLWIQSRGSDGFISNCQLYVQLPNGGKIKMPRIESNFSAGKRFTQTKEPKTRVIKLTFPPKLHRRISKMQILKYIFQL